MGSVRDGGSDRCKGPEARVCLEGLGDPKEAGVAGMEGMGKGMTVGTLYRTWRATEALSRGEV